MKIFVQGIKSIAQGQYVDIGNKLTFLVGPNSSGKSSVLTAIELLDKELSVSPPLAGMSDLTGHRSHTAVFRFFQRRHTVMSHLKERDIHANPNNNNSTAGISSVGLSWDEDEEREIIFSRISESSPIEAIRRDAFDFFYVNPLERDGLDEWCSKISYFKAGALILEDFYGPIDCTKFSRKAFPREIDDVAAWLRGILDRSIDQENGSDRQPFEFLDPIEADIDNGYLPWMGAIFADVISTKFKGSERQSALNSLQKFNARLRRLRDRAIFEYKNPKLEFHSISPERYIPRREDLIKVLSDDSSSEDGAAALMSSAINRDWPAWIKEGLELAPADMIDEVNKSLSTHLFSDAGYQVVVKSKILMSRSELEDALDEFGSQIQLDDKAFHCELFLIDCHGRQLNFSDVGSGIGFVFPILLACFNEYSGVSLQQPELHLHPALQSGLADVFIEASKDKKIMCETHSEHIILRALRRVRQTTSGTLADQALALKSNDLAFNYFEPVVGGFTRIHNLRVSDDGDFIDPWPNGFFSERDEDLFGE